VTANVHEFTGSSGVIPAPQKAGFAFGAGCDCSRGFRCAGRIFIRLSATVPKKQIRVHQIMEPREATLSFRYSFYWVGTHVGGLTITRSRRQRLRPRNRNGRDAMKKPSKPRKQGRPTECPQPCSKLEIGREPGPTTPVKRGRLAPFYNGRNRNSFWGFDGPDGRP
jgi:hypothetical protein